MDTLQMVAGTPFIRRIRFPTAQTIWSDLATLEVRAQLRDGYTTGDRLIADLHDFMTASFDGDSDIVVDWQMTGADTRTLYGLNWGSQKRGYFNVILSDTGVIDARAWVLETIQLDISDTTTTAGDPDE